MLSLSESVRSHVSDLNSDLGQKHITESNWIIEKCGVTLQEWKVSKTELKLAREEGRAFHLIFCMFQDDPSLIQHQVNQTMDSIADGFLVLNEPDVFTVIVEKISILCAYVVGQLIKLISRYVNTELSATVKTQLRSSSESSTT